jgi:hypothetical protein
MDLDPLFRRLPMTEAKILMVALLGGLRVGPAGDILRSGGRQFVA